MTAKTALLIDDDPGLYTALATLLYEQRYSLIITSTGRHAMELCRVDEISVIVLDLDLREGNGLILCHTLRSHIGPSGAPILAISSHSSESDRLAGFEAGASDYLVKPVSVSELAARIRVHAARDSDLSNIRELTCGPVRIHRASRVVTISGNQVSLTATEYRLLEWLVSHPNSIFTREELIASVWPCRDRANERIVDVCIRRIRHKLSLRDATEVIHSVRGFGYTCSAIGSD